MLGDARNLWSEDEKKKKKTISCFVYAVTQMSEWDGSDMATSPVLLSNLSQQCHFEMEIVKAATFFSQFAHIAAGEIMNINSSTITSKTVNISMFRLKRRHRSWTIKLWQKCHLSPLSLWCWSFSKTQVMHSRNKNQCDYLCIFQS